MSHLWKRIDVSHNIRYINETDVCIFAREYIPGQGFNGDTNQLIMNFKKPPSARNTNQWPYRERDVKRFAQEIADGMPQTLTAAITAIPESKAETDPDYTGRFEDMLTELQRLRPGLVAEWPVEAANTVRAAHDGGSRDPAEIKQNLRWRGFNGGTPEMLIIVDDVVTRGSHFRAMSDFIRENGYQGKIVGVFWARAIRPPATVVFEPVE